MEMKVITFLINRNRTTASKNTIMMEKRELNARWSFKIFILNDTGLGRKKTALMIIRRNILEI